MKANIYKTVNIVLQITLFIVAYGFIYRELFHKRDLSNFVCKLKELFYDPNWWWVLALVFLLFWINWGLEAQKWRYLLNRYEKTGFWLALKAVFSGVTAGFFTPNRTGEFAGRIFLLKQLSHIEGILISVVGNIGQLIATVIIGSVALIFFMPNLFPIMEMANGWLYNGTIVATIATNLLLVIIYLSVSKVAVWGRGLMRPKWTKLQQYCGVFSSFASKQLSIVLLLSVLRVVAYTLQFVLLIKAFNIPLTWLQALMVVPVLFLVITFIPTIAITELGIRGSTSLYLMGLFFSDSDPLPEQIAIGIVSASTLLWLINRGIPALLGTLFIFQFRFFRNNDG